MSGHRKSSSTSLPTISEREIWLIAGLMLQEFGGRAESTAYQRAEKALETKDVAGQSLWNRVIRSISAITETEGETLH